MSEQQLRVWEGEENVAHQKAADALVKPLKGAVLWGQGQVAVDWDGKCPVCKKVCSCWWRLARRGMLDVVCGVGDGDLAVVGRGGVLCW